MCYYSVRKGAISRAVSVAYSFLVPLLSFAKRKKETETRIRDAEREKSEKSERGE